MKSIGKTLFYVALMIALIGVPVYYVVSWDKDMDEVTKSMRQAAQSHDSITDFLDALDRGEVEAVEIETGSNKLKWVTTNSIVYQINAPPGLADNLDFINNLREKKIEVKITSPASSSWSYIFWILIIIVPIILFMSLGSRAGGAGPNQINKFTSSRARKFARDKDSKEPSITFKDVAGCDQAKEEVKEVIDFLKSPEKFQKLGAKIPKGVLLVGSPGTGKTLFLQAKKNAPCVVFIDELDAIGRQRGAGFGGGNDEREQTLNQILIEIDGFESDKTVIVMAATNRPDVLDPALVRPGRFDRQIVINKPDIKGREEILKIHARNIPLADDTSLTDIARATPGFVGADLANLVNEAALIAGRRNKQKVERSDFEDAKDRVMMGLAQGKIMNQREKRIVAYHEAGHTLVAKSLPNTDPVNKVTIIPRGLSLGATHSLPEEDRRLYFKDYLLDEISVLLGGRVAEELLGEGVTNGASNDIERATQLAKAMVCQWGMSNLGLLLYGNGNKEVFLGRDFGHVKDYSDETAKLIDMEVKRIIDERHAAAKEILTARRTTLDKLANKLQEKETLDKEEIDDIVSN
ncbi:MAG: ATP-dependent zinc metalloprotease FtsH [Candidatus Azambacteria bacterium GW2011_GWA2_45_90]|uniref:ATP-dependent zinc metalloprotease FtsH n=1 Tax=Candidatus Azambacteria bacterium GW2011_GWA2_45_90 TaxID=1618614 RepID=A0A0G1QHQ9_9BACT|nr:MAG: ATP-dependent zinc metalloprotease FtsH [Candidatus Azambacteria bacterium GW2011_GWA2_45_90]